jgi:hypothetical protein
MSEGEDVIRVTVRPVPADEEMAVISAVIAALRAGESGVPEEAVPRGGGRERWARAGRREVLRPIDRDASE